MVLQNVATYLKTLLKTFEDASLTSQAKADFFCLAKLSAFIFELLEAKDVNLGLLKSLILYIQSIHIIPPPTSEKIEEKKISSSMSVNAFKWLWLWPVKHPTIKELFSQENISLLNEPLQTKNHDDVSLSYSYLNDLQFVHRKLLRYYQFAVNAQAKTVWHASYPLQDGEVSNDLIKLWKEEKACQVDGGQRALMDLSRSIDIEGLRETDAETKELFVEKAIGDLLITAPTYSVEEKEILSKWLLNNGGHNIESFIRIFLEKKEFHTNIYRVQLASSLGRCWYLEEDGYIYFSSDTLIHSLVGDERGIEKCMLFDPRSSHKGALLKIARREIEELELESYFKSKELDPLLRIQAKIKLEINGGCPHLKMVELNVMSFTPYLKMNLHPELQVNKDIENKPEQIKEIKESNVRFAM